MRGGVVTGIKYGRYGSRYVTPMTSDSVAETTLRLGACWLNDTDN